MKYVKEQVKTRFWRKDSKLRKQQGPRVEGGKEPGVFMELKERVAGAGLCASLWGVVRNLDCILCDEQKGEIFKQRCDIIGFRFSKKNQSGHLEMLD